MSLLGDLGTAIKNKLGGTSVDNTVPRYDGTTCKLQGSGVTISDTNVVTASGGFVGSLTGNAATVTNGVYTTGDQTIAGVKTFSDNVVFNGNVGIGGTPSGWRSASKAINIGASGNIESLTNNGSYVSVNANNYNNGTNDIYIHTATATKYQQTAGTHSWFTAPSGTAGNPIPWTNAMTLGANGNLLVGTTTDNGVDKLQVNGGISATTFTGALSGNATTATSLQAANSYRVNSLGIGTPASGNTGELRATGSGTFFYSDERLKENIKLIENALEKVDSLRGVTYEPNDVALSYGYKKEKMIGVIAQDVECVAPEAVKPAPFDRFIGDDGIEVSKSGQDYKTVQYEKLVPLLIEAIKELNREIKELKRSK